MSKIESSFFKRNRINYFNKMEDSSLTVLFSGLPKNQTADQDYHFEVNRNFYYLTGINQDNVILVITKCNGKMTETLFLEENDPVNVKWVGAKLYKEEATNLSGISDIRYIPQFKGYIFALLNQSRNNTLKIDNVYCDLERKNVEGYTTCGLRFAKEMKDNYPNIVVRNCYNILIGLRMIKDSCEIELIKESIKTTKGGIEALMKNSKGGMYEYQLESYFDQYIKCDGNKPVSFTTIAASGVNATILHYHTNHCILNDNDMILFDLGCCTDLYISDISRTFPVNGKFSPRCKEIYQAVLNVNKSCIEFLKPGITWNEYNKYANDLLAKEMIKLGLIESEVEFRKYYWHSIGHFIGLDTHDPGLYDTPLCEGMVLTCEPGIYVEEEKIGVRIEDDILITADGCVNLSSDIIKEVEDIEKFMEK